MKYVPFILVIFSFVFCVIAICLIQNLILRYGLLGFYCGVLGVLIQFAIEKMEK